MKPTTILIEEHKNILKVIDVLNEKCNLTESKKTIDRDFFKNAIDFIRNYADKFHHAKEEDLLFKELCSDDVEMHCNPTEQMRYEHELGRGFVKGMIEALEKSDIKKLTENAREYCALLRDHIYKEDNILYPMADEVLNAKKQKVLLDKFKKIEDKTDVKKYLGFVKKL